MRNNGKRSPKGAPLAERIDRLLAPPDNNGCRVFTGARTPQGYGRITVDKPNPSLAHRLAWMLAHGPIPAGLYVLHSCDNPPCCTLAHLRLGTAKDNSDDKIKRGRYLHADHIRGSKNPLAKLCEEQVSKILSDTRSSVQLARAYGVCRRTITLIRQRKIWAHVTR